MRGFFAEVFARHNLEHKTSSGRIERVMLLAVPPQLDANETTDKGYINQIAVLRNRADLVDLLYVQSAPSEVILVEVTDASQATDRVEGELTPETLSGDLSAPAPAAPSRRQQRWWHFGRG